MTTNEVINKYLHFGGDRKQNDFAEFLKQANQAKLKHERGTKDYILIEYVENKLIHGLSMCLKYGEIFAVIDEESREEIEEILRDAGYLSGAKPTKAKAKKKSRKKNLGKVVDHGKVAPRGKSDVYWKREGIEIVFNPHDPKVRTGGKIPETYKYADMFFIKEYYNLSGIEFGNWLSQQDRLNYLSGLGIALFDLHKALKFTPEQISIKGKLSVAFGARGRGKAMAHFEPGTFAINLTRYSRPPKVKNRKLGFSRVEQILKDGGVGAFAHEYGHALDYFGGLHVERGDTFSLSGDKDTDPRPNPFWMKQNTLRGLMEKLLFKICWKTPTVSSNYYTRLVKSAHTEYYLQRNEIFARAFEIYVQLKLQKINTKNTFLNFPKYDTDVYMTIAEMQGVEKEFDSLMNALKKHL